MLYVLPQSACTVVGQELSSRGSDLNVARLGAAGGQRGELEAPAHAAGLGCLVRDGYLIRLACLVAARRGYGELTGSSVGRLRVVAAGCRACGLARRASVSGRRALGVRLRAPRVHDQTDPNAKYKNADRNDLNPFLDRHAS